MTMTKEQRRSYLQDAFDVLGRFGNVLNTLDDGEGADGQDWDKERAWIIVAQKGLLLLIEEVRP